MNAELQNNWANRLGVLPINFRHNQIDDEKVFAMLNGGINNFCLGFDFDVDYHSFMNEVWSANMSNFISVKGEKLLLYNLYDSSPEEINYRNVVVDIRRFYDYLGTKNVRQGDSVIRFVLQHFREIRNLLREEHSAENSLKVFLYILSLINDTKEHLSNWRLPEGTEDIVLSIDNNIIEQTIEDLRLGLNNMFQPKTDLVLRHCAGLLFQEANYIAHFSPQLELFPVSNLDYEINPKLIGAYFTPPYIARTIVEETLRKLNVNDLDEITIFDPACGSGVFLAEALRQLRSRNYTKKVNVIGWDIDQLAIDMANYVMQFEKREWKDNQLEFVNKRCNSLCCEWPQADIIFMNPPYISWSLMNDVQREQSIRIVGNSQRPNMAALFYILAARNITKNGAIGCLMPTSMLVADSMSYIRKEANNIIRPSLVCHVGNFVFTSAFTDVSIIIASNQTISEKVQMVWTKNVDEVTPLALRRLRVINNTNQEGESDSHYSIYNEQFSYLNMSDSWLPLPYKGVLLKQHLENMINNGLLFRAEQLFDIRQGARTGANDIFIINKQQYSKLPTKEKKYYRPSIDNSSVNNGVVTISNYLFYPYPEDKLGFKDEMELADTIPYIYNNILLPNIDKLKNRSGIDIEKWWLLTRPRPWQFCVHPKLISTEFGSSGSFGVDSEGIFVVERGLEWSPKIHMENLDVYYLYLSIFSSNFFNQLLALYSKQLAGGEFYNLEAKFVNNIPLPNLTKLDTKYRKILYDNGRYISSVGVVDNKMVESIIMHIYGK